MNRAARRSHLAAWLIIAPITIGILIAAILTRARTAAAIASQPPPPARAEVRP